jgi:mono/diheme cytochrome c family protein
MGRVFLGLGLASALAGAASGQAAQDALGRQEYMLNCAQCHGIDGTGDGVIAGFLNVAPPDLTVIARENGGELPFEILYGIISGGTATGPHGTREMPAWGDRFSVEALQLLGFRLSPEERAEYVESRILALIAHIDSIQKP